MALTKSKMVELGSSAYQFSLVDTVSGKIFTLPEVGLCKGVLLMFICNHCPYVKHIADELARIGTDYADSGIEIFAISSNDIKAYPQDGPELMRQEALNRNYNFPYLFDESQSVAKDYGAVCTPDFFLYDSKLSLVYRGQLDDSSPGSDTEVTGKDLRKAIKAVISGLVPDTIQHPSMGCNIKWAKTL